MHFNSKDDKIYQVICLGFRCCSQFLHLYRIMDAIYQKEMSVSHSSCLKQAERGMDMNPKQYFFSLKESHHVRVSDSLPTAWSRFQSHTYLKQAAICQVHLSAGQSRACWSPQREASALILNKLRSEVQPHVVCQEPVSPAYIILSQPPHTWVRMLTTIHYANNHTNVQFPREIK